MSDSETNRDQRVLLKVEAVTALIGVSRATLYRMVNAGDFPKPLQLSPKRVAWLQAEVDAWFQTKIEERSGE